MVGPVASSSSSDNVPYSLVALIESSPDNLPDEIFTKRIQGAASLLSAQWPHLGSLTSRASQLRSRAKATTVDTLPVSIDEGSAYCNLILSLFCLLNLVESTTIGKATSQFAAFSEIGNRIKVVRKTRLAEMWIMGKYTDLRTYCPAFVKRVSVLTNGNKCHLHWI
jgi:hypothetical protein